MLRRTGRSSAIRIELLDQAPGQDAAPIGFVGSVDA